jgi:hypothetical protein
MAHKSYPPNTGLARGVQDGYSDNDYRLKFNHWHIHELWECEISPIYYVVLSGEVLWLTSYVL